MINPRRQGKAVFKGWALITQRRSFGSRVIVNISGGAWCFGMPAPHYRCVTATGFGWDETCNYQDLSWIFLILEAEQGAEAEIRHQFDGYIRALNSLVFRQQLEKTLILHQHLSSCCLDLASNSCWVSSLTLLKVWRWWGLISWPEFWDSQHHSITEIHPR